LAQLTQLAAARPAAVQPKPLSAAPAKIGPRKLSVLELARTRKLILRTIPEPAGAEILRQVIWAIEEGALKRFEARYAINIALKKVREGGWSTPHRMPPNWLPQNVSRRLALTEQCSLA
jgi:hypothetical protein